MTWNQDGYNLTAKGGYFSRAKWEPWGDPATSDGIFVFTGSANLVSAGQVVRVTGFARERFNQTAINGTNSNSSAVPAANIINCGTGSVAATDVSLPFASTTDRSASRACWSACRSRS